MKETHVDIATVPSRLCLQSNLKNLVSRGSKNFMFTVRHLEIRELKLCTVNQLVKLPVSFKLIRKLIRSNARNLVRRVEPSPFVSSFCLCSSSSNATTTHVFFPFFFLIITYFMLTLFKDFTLSLLDV